MLTKQNKTPACYGKTISIEAAKYKELHLKVLRTAVWETQIPVNGVLAEGIMGL